ncbi:nucleoside deaminase [Halobacteriales archaeon QH_10_67_13]|nr:MAG: nucleoside deaminase [Halobacteriales archaeon QH_10_67_13]
MTDPTDAAGSEEATHLRSAIELAAAAPDGHPYGAVLVDETGAVVARAKNTVPSDGLAAHPELKLAERSTALAPERRAGCTLYASTEPCEMCTAAIHYAGIGRVVFGVARATLADRQGTAPGVSCRELLDRKGSATVVEGPLLQREALAVHD